MRITQKSLSAHVADDSVMSDAELANVQSIIGKLMEREFEKAFGFAPKFPEFIEIQERKCSCYVVHRGYCDFACIAT